MRRFGRFLFCAFILLPAVLRAEDGPDVVPSFSAEADAGSGDTQGTAPDAKPTKPPIEYVQYRGVVFRTPDGLFEASLGFNLQVRFSDFDLDIAAGGVDAEEFRVRRFKLFMTGFALDPRLTWRFQADFASTAANRYLDDAWLNWKFADELSAQFGEYKTPYSREELYNDGFIQFPERAIAVDAFKPSRDIGFMAAGGFHKDVLMYSVGVFGGDGQNTLRVTNHVMPVARVVLNLFSKMGNSEADLQNHEDLALSLGVNGFTNTLKKISNTAFEALTLNYAGPAGWLGRSANIFTTGEDVAVKSWGFDGQFKWHGLAIQGEGFYGQAKGDTSGVRLYAYGWYAQAGYMILPEHLDIAGRYSLIDYNRSVDNDSIAAISADTNYYFKQNSVKITFDYTRTHRQRVDPFPANDQAFVIQVQLMP